VVREAEGEEPTRLEVDLGAVLRGGKREEDLVVEDGDRIFIPDRAVDWDLILRAISSFSLVGNVFLD
jgi:hypothetical protein